MHVCNAARVVVHTRCYNIDVACCHCKQAGSGNVRPAQQPVSCERLVHAGSKGAPLGSMGLM